MRLTFNICTTHPAPAMTQDRFVFKGTAKDAAVAAYDQHKATGRTVGLYDGECGSHCWMLFQNGKITIDRLTHPQPPHSAFK